MASSSACSFLEKATPFFHCASSTPSLALRGPDSDGSSALAAALSSAMYSSYVFELSICGRQPTTQWSASAPRARVAERPRRPSSWTGPPRPHRRWPPAPRRQRPCPTRSAPPPRRPPPCPSRSPRPWRRRPPRSRPRARAWPRRRPSPGALSCPSRCSGQRGRNRAGRTGCPSPSDGPGALRERRRVHRAGHVPTHVRGRRLCERQLRRTWHGQRCGPRMARTSTQ